MGKMLISLSDDVEKTFRELIIEKWGRKKGAISIAGEEAIKDWIKKNTE